jgi:hypothetical protein
MVEVTINIMRISQTCTWALAAALCSILAAACALKTSGHLAGDATTDVPVEVVGDNLCPAGMTPCGEVCVNTDTSRNNCGACGNVCDPIEQCEEGACVCPLDEGALECDGVCVDPLTDSLNCGGCGNACEAPAFCAGGDCTCPGDASRMRLCGVNCVDIFTDSGNCGGCGIACTDGQMCNGAGECDLNCTGAFVRCGSAPNEYCADLQSDPHNCLECGLACEAPDHAFPVCDGGVCSSQCEPGWVDVDTTNDDGCECQIRSTTETCDGTDENCDGTVDEGFDCSPGDVEGCSACGSRTCDDTCHWGPCAGSGTCEPDEELVEPCCATGTRTMTCQPDCSWGPWSPCSITVDCDPTEPPQEQPCCGSGTQTRTCRADCTWSEWTPCGSTGVCRPGATQCCNGWDVQVCGSDCQWGTCTFCGDVPEKCCDGATQACAEHNHPCPGPY